VTIRRIKAEPKAQKIAVYDLEWVPETYRLRVAGLYDGATYQAFPTVEHLLNAMLHPRWKGYRFFAHASGLADIHFLLEKIAQKPGIKVNACFSGSSAIIVRVKWKKVEYVFCDSYCLLRDKLAHLGKYIGVHKSRGSYRCPDFPACGHVGRACSSAPKCGCEEGPEPLCMFYAPLDILTRYNEQDCKLLYQALTTFQDLVLEMGCEMRSTIASTALGLFRTKYLTESIETSAVLNDTIRSSYIASRVEIFREYVRPPANYFDVNSSFPFAATFPAPGEYLGQSLHAPPERELYFAQADVLVPEMYLPPLGHRGRDGRIYFPTGRWTGLFSQIDLELLERVGGKIQRVEKYFRFRPFHDLSEYALDLYRQRLEAKKAGNDFLAITLKFLLNTGCYGKFAERREKTELVLHPYDEECPHDGKHKRVIGGQVVSTCVEPLFPGCILVTDDKDVPHEHVAISAWITSRGRKTLYDAMAPCGEDLYYCDTDSIVTGHTLPTGDKLGELKLEYTIQKSGRFVQPKLYEIDGKIKSKGFSYLTPEQFKDLVEGRDVVVERMFRVKETARELSKFGAFAKHFAKKVRLGATRPKRCPTHDGGTRPWTVKEIGERWVGMGR
jgi:DNA polymerase type B, organellar and viral